MCLVLWFFDRFEVMEEVGGVVVAVGTPAFAGRNFVQRAVTFSGPLRVGKRNLLMTVT